MIKFKPGFYFKQHQLDAAELCNKYNRYLVRVDVGGGKTLTQLKVLDDIPKDEKWLKLVLFPKSGISTWIPELKKFTDYTYSLNELRSDVDVNFFTFPNIEEVFKKTKGLNKEHNAILLVDECHLLMSAESQQAENLRGRWIWDTNTGSKEFTGIIGRFKRAYGFSATMMGNHIENIYYVVISFFPGFFKDYESFMNFYTVRVLRKATRFDREKKRMVDYHYKEVVEYKNLEHLNKVLGTIMYQYSINYNPKFQHILCKLSDEEKALYYEAGAHGLSRGGKNFAGRLPLLQTIVNGSVDKEGNYSHNQQLSSKEQKLIEVLNTIADRKEGAIVFTQSKTDTMRRFRSFPPYLRFRKCYFMTGDTNDVLRNEIRESLSVNECLFATKVGGTSLNLQAVNNIIFYDIPWGAHEVFQNIGRITRMDSSYNVFNIYFILAEDTIDIYKYMLFQNVSTLHKAIFGNIPVAPGYMASVKRDMVLAIRNSILWGKKKKVGFVLEPTVKCSCCGKWTNHTVSINENGTITGCYAHINEGTQKWEPGCKYEQATEFIKYFISKLKMGDNMVLKNSSESGEFEIFQEIEL